VFRKIGSALVRGATEDRQWIHVDRAGASEESPYGTTSLTDFLLFL